MAPPLQPLQPPPPRESHAPIAADEQSPADGATAATSSPTPPPASHDPPAAPVTPRLQQSNRSVEPDRHSASHPPGGELATSAAPAQRQTTAAAELRQTRAAAVAPAPLLPVFQDVAVMSHERSADTTPTVHVTIGRIDIRATVAPPAAAPPARRVLPSRPALSLSDYLQRRQGGRS
jgi:hypothetical protein